MLFLTNNGPAILAEELADLVVSEHSTLASVWTGGSRSSGRSSKDVLILVGESEAPTVERHPEDQLLGRTTTVQPIAYGCVLQKNQRKGHFSMEMKFRPPRRFEIISQSQILDPEREKHSRR